LAPRKPAVVGAAAEWRVVESAARALGARPKCCWQLSGAGAVGGQVLTGVPAVARLRGRLEGAAAVWPFETGLAASDVSVVFAEIYPSLVPISSRPNEVKDAAQVRATAAHFAGLQAEDRLAALFAAPGAEPGVRPAVATEEGWILGLELFGEDRPQTTDVGATGDAALAGRLREAIVAACGRAEPGEALECPPGAAEAAAAALANGAPVICDGALAAAALPGRAEALGADAAVWAAWANEGSGAVVALGEHPAAARSLAAALSAGGAAPAAVLSFVPGIDGAAEAKAALASAASSLGAPLIWLPGPEGGAGLAAAALRVLADV